MVFVLKESSGNPSYIILKQIGIVKSYIQNSFGS